MFTIDSVVLAYVAGICVLSAVLFGLAPALLVSKAGTNAMLKDRRARACRQPARAAVQRRHRGCRAGADDRAPGKRRVDGPQLHDALPRGPRHSHRAPRDDAHPAPRGKVSGTPEARRGLFEQLEPRLAAIPGVEDVCVTTGVPPLDGGERLLEIDGPGRVGIPAGVRRTVAISPRFFDVVGAGVVRGRGFTERDGAPGSETVIVNERLAAQFFPGRIPSAGGCGSRDGMRPRERSADVWRTIVGVSPTIRQGSPTDEYLNAVVYIPLRQESPAAASLLIRSALTPGSVMEAVRREVQADRSGSAGPRRSDGGAGAGSGSLVVPHVGRVVRNPGWRRAPAVVDGALRGHGLLGHERTPEIGVRMALALSDGRCRGSSSGAAAGNWDRTGAGVCLLAGVDRCCPAGSSR